jgi:copper(I)-binding protein
MAPSHRALTLLTAGLLVTLVARAGLAHDYKVGPLVVDHPWTRATPKGASVAGGYLKVTNNGSAADRLVGGTVEAAGRFEIHQMSLVNGVMQMRPLPAGVEVKAGATLELKPGSFHLMFLDLKQPLAQGQRVKGTLVFEKAGKVDVEFNVEAIAGPLPAPGAHQGH